jgi:DNA polymerase-1
MRHILWADQPTYSTAVLVKATSFDKREIETNYIDPLGKLGVVRDDVIAFTLEYGGSKKPTAKYMKEYLSNLLLALKSLDTKRLYVTDSSYFKTLTSQAKAEPHYGYVLPCRIKGYEHMEVVLGLNYHALIYDPTLQAKLDLSLKTLADSIQGSYQPLGQGIIHSAHYPEGPRSIQEALEALHQYPRLTADIEAFSLAFHEAGIGTIAFAQDQHNGVAFPCDYRVTYNPHDSINNPNGGEYVGYKRADPEVRALIKHFLETYQGEIAWHNSPYDLKVLIYTLWMKDGLDTEGLLCGLNVVTRNFQDTKVIAYLALNSTAGNVLGLKALAHEFAGNWAVEEIQDIRKIPLKKLLQYNLVDALSTAYVRDKYYPIMVVDQQEHLYRTMMLPGLKMIIQTELTGMPLDPVKVKEVKAKLEAIRDTHLAAITNSPVIKVYNLIFRQKAMEEANAKLKVKQHPLSHFDNLVFNPRSGPQLQHLLYEIMDLPVIDLTDTKQPATGAETLEKLINHTQDLEYKKMLAALIGFGKAEKILSTFIPAFELAISKGDGVVWLHGSFNLNGPVSGRLSSSDPNLQNLPALSAYAKLIKECFVGPVGWLFCGADFNSLEDYISALTTKDPNKLKVYERGFDGHCLRAAYYYREELPHIDLDDPKSVNEIKKTHPELRQDSKIPTFALTYQGTYHTLMANLGFSETKARMIEDNYHELYKVSDEYIQKRLEQATKDGYVTVAFGLRVRTPLLGQVVWGTRIPYEAAAEGRTAGNAMGQSYCMLNTRAAIEFMEKVWVSPYRLDIKPVALIHDAIYILVRDRSDVMEWANRELIKSMQWQDLPEIQHPTVKLGAALDIFWPNWSKSTTLPNGASREEIYDICQAAKGELLMTA